MSASPPFLGRPASRSHSTLTPENPEKGPWKLRGEDLESLFGHWHQACEHRQSQHPRVACIADTPSGWGAGLRTHPLQEPPRVRNCGGRNQHRDLYLYLTHGATVHTWRADRGSPCSSRSCSCYQAQRARTIWVIRGSVILASGCTCYLLKKNCRGVMP